MNGLPYYKRYPRDLIEGTIGMPFELKVTYAFVLDLIYLQGGKLPDDERYISGLLGCSIRKWKVLRNALLETGKILSQNDYLFNERADSELAHLSSQQRTNSENRSRPNKNKDLESRPFNHTESDTDTERKKQQEGAPPSSSSGGDEYAFAGAHIKLNQADFDRWKKAFHAIPDLKAKLASLDDWFANVDPKNGKGWFHRTSSILADDHQKRIAEQQTAEKARAATGGSAWW